MANGPWDVTGPWAPSQTPEAIRGRYLRSIAVLAALVLPLMAFLIWLGDDPILTITNVVISLGTTLLPASADAKFTDGVRLALKYAMPALPVLITFTAIQALPIFLVWWEMKVAAHLQIRLGPMRVGRWHGILQTLADGIKLLLKEDIVPKGADKVLHTLAPIIVVGPAFMSFAPMPFGNGNATVNMDVGLLYIMAISGLSVIGLLLAGWASNNKYSVLGGLRAAAQVVSYEIPRVIAVLPIVMWAGTMSLTGIAAAQTGLWNGFLPKWFIFYPVVGQLSFIIYIIASIAETNRTPFDIAEAESELTSGFHTEYSGMKWAMFFLGEYAYMFLACALGAILFFGGTAAPWEALKFIPGHVWFFAKTFFLVFLFIWFRWTFPRLRVDRLMEFCWKFLLPWSLVNVALAGLFILLRQ